MHTHKKNLLHIRNPTMYLHIKASAGQPPGSPKTLGTKRSHKNMQVKKKRGGGEGESFWIYVKLCQTARKVSFAKLTVVPQKVSSAMAP